MFLISCGGSKKISTSTSRTKKTTPKQKSITKVERTTRAVTSKKTSKSVVKKPLSTLSYKDRVRQYISEFSDIAKSEMKSYGIPASITLAQGILESGAGYGDLTSRAKNHFGIKCHDWEGDRVYHDDDRLQECFRKYDQASESFRDHSLFKKDYKSWARGLREAGYATDKKYPQKLIAIIESYQLYEFDNDVLSRKKRKINKQKASDVIVSKPTPDTNNDDHVVQQGDTLYSIARRYKISVQELKTYNNLANNNIKIGQVLKIAIADVEEEEDFN